MEIPAAADPRSQAVRIGGSATHQIIIADRRKRWMQQACLIRRRDLQWSCSRTAALVKHGPPDRCVC